jgi:hypothetical protein
VRREAVWQKTFLVTTLILFMMTMISTTLLTKEAYSQTQNPPAENKIIRNFQTMDLLAGQINDIANLTIQNPSPSQMENATLQISTKAYGILQLSNEITIIQSDLKVASVQSGTLNISAANENSSLLLPNLNSNVTIGQKTMTTIKNTNSKERLVDLLEVQAFDKIIPLAQQIHILSSSASKKPSTSDESAKLNMLISLTAKQIDNLSFQAANLGIGKLLILR